MSSSSHSKLVTNTKNKIIERLKDKNFKKFYEPVLMNTTIISKAIHSKTLNKNRVILISLIENLCIKIGKSNTLSY